MLRNFFFSKIGINLYSIHGNATKLKKKLKDTMLQNKVNQTEKFQIFNFLLKILGQST